MNDKQLKKILKLSVFKHADDYVIKNEINSLENLCRSNNSHIIKLNKNKYISYDLPIINSIANQNGRGNYRGLYDIKTGYYIGLAEHRNNGQYRLVA